MGAMTVVAGRRPIEELAGEIRSGAVRLAAATAAWLVLVAEVDEREGWGGVGIVSCAHWLAWQCGMSPGAAREHVRVARYLSRLLITAAAFWWSGPPIPRRRSWTGWCGAGAARTTSMPVGWPTSAPSSGTGTT